MLGLDQNQVDLLLDSVAEYCFKKGMTIDLIIDKQKELNKLKEEIIFNGMLNDQLLREHNVTKVQLQAFVVYWPFLLKLRALKQILLSMDI